MALSDRENNRMTEEEFEEYQEEYSESDGMKSESEYNEGIHMDADKGCKSHDDYGGRRNGGGSRGDYNDASWRGWTNENDEDTF
jgi:hypothetical protein